MLAFRAGRAAVRLATIVASPLAVALAVVAAPAAAQHNAEARRACERQVAREQRVDRGKVRIDDVDRQRNTVRVRGSVRRDGPDVQYVCRVDRGGNRVLAIEYSRDGRQGDGRWDNDRSIDEAVAERARRACRARLAQSIGPSRDEIVISRVRRDEGHLRVDGFFRVERGGDRGFSCIVDDDGPGAGRVLRVIQ